MARRKTANPARPWYVRVFRYTVFAGLAGQTVQKVQTGKVQTYMVLAIIGLMALLAIYI